MKKLYRKGTVHPSPPLVSDHLSFLPAAVLTLAVALSHEDKEVLAYLISCSSGNFSGNQQTSEKSTAHNSASPNSSTGGKSGAAMNGGIGGGGGGGADFSGQFYGNRKNTHKSTIPSSAQASSGGGGKGGSGCADHVPAFNCYCFSCYMSYWVKWDSSPNRQLIHEILDAYEDGLQTKKEKSKKERRNKNKSSTIIESCELKKNENGSGPGPGSSQSDNPVEETSGSRGDGGDDEEGGGGGDEQEATEKGSVRRFVSFLGERIWSVWT